MTDRTAFYWDGRRKGVSGHMLITRDGIAYFGEPAQLFDAEVHYQFGPYHRLGLGPWHRTWDAARVGRECRMTDGRLPK